MASNTGELFTQYSTGVLESLGNAVNMAQGTQNPTTFKHARDNAVSSIGKIIKHHGSSVDLNQTASFWFQQLPLRADKDEAKFNNDLLADILQNQPALILGA